jgi:hypothetical protein
LLADTATFPYYLSGRVTGGNLEVRGYVPNAMVRQRVLDIARRTTALRVIDGLELLARPRVHAPAPRLEVLQQEATELLSKHFSELARRVRIEARSDGVLTLNGSLNSIEEKLTVCKLFRQLSGCSGVVDQLSIQPIVRDGQRVVPVTKDAALTAPPPMPVAKATQPTVTTVSTSAPSALRPQQDELRLPTIVSGKTTTAKPEETGTVKPPAPVMKWGQSAKEREGSKSDGKTSTVAATTSPALVKPPVPWTNAPVAKTDDARAVKPPAPVSKWGQPAMSWESQVKPKPVVNASKDAVAKTTVSPTEKTTTKSAKKSKPDVFASQQRPGESSKGSTDSVAALTAPTPPRRWQHSGGSEESEPHVEPLTKPVPSSTSASASSARKTESQPTAIAPVHKTPAPLPKPIARQADSSPRPDGSMRPTPSPTPAPIVWPETRQALPEATTRKTPADRADTDAERRLVTGNSDPRPRRPASTISQVVRLDRPSRWPPAYDIRPAEPKNGRPGVIEFDDEPTEEPAPQPAPQSAAARLGPVAKRVVVPAELRRNIAAVCGKQAREVIVEQQRDGSVQVRVKVASPAIGDQLTQKILTIPEMASPKVRLTVDVSR